MLFKATIVLLSGSVAFGSAFAIAHAQTAPAAATAGAAAGCFVSPAALPPGDVSAFVADPPGLLTNYPTGGLPMSGRVRGLAGTSADTLAPLVSLLESANPSQVAAIGAGLARAARACAPINPEYAVQIQEAVAGAGNPVFEAAFLGASADTQTAALGAAGGAPGAGAIGGGGTPGGGLNGTGGGNESVASGNSSFSAGASARFFASSGAGAATFDSVSPNGNQ
ncbi:hypothetical protein SAMN03159496_04499 [Rhizobium sp. NFR07]|nr:hypothetical protein SAMN03159496_04499 [Rhizobium sp. NFR07]